MGIEKRCYVKVIEGYVSYEEGLRLQEEAKEKVKSGEADCILLLLQHEPVFSVGKAGGAENILMPEEFLKEKGIKVHKSDRGGNVTYHGPGQLVGYPIMNLKKFNPDVHWYFFQLEQVLINVLKDFGIEGGRKEKYPGVWIGDRKIAAIGVHISRWITTHGFSFNISVNKEHFGYINPCGITEFGIASMEDYGSPSFEEIRRLVISHFEKIFELKWSE